MILLSRAVAGKYDCGRPLTLLSSSVGARLRRTGVENGLVGGLDGIGGVGADWFADMTKGREVNSPSWVYFSNFSKLPK